MSTLIHERVESAQRGDNPTVIGRLASGFAVLADGQGPFIWTVLLPAPVVPTLGDLDETGRRQFLSDMAALGDAALSYTGGLRCNFEILGNADPALHAHVFIRLASETAAYRRKPVWAYPAKSFAATPFDLVIHYDLMRGIRTRLSDAGRLVDSPPPGG